MGKASYPPQGTDLPHSFPSPGLSHLCPQRGSPPSHRDTNMEPRATPGPGPWTSSGVSSTSTGMVPMCSSRTRSASLTLKQEDQGEHFAGVPTDQDVRFLSRSVFPVALILPSPSLPVAQFPALHPQKEPSVPGSWTKFLESSRARSRPGCLVESGRAVYLLPLLCRVKSPSSWVI